MSDSSPKPSRPPDVSSRTLEIAHVLFTDIVGYSTLPMDQQEQLLMQLQEAVRQTPEFARAEAADELIRLPTGDGMALVFFRDAEAPVRCALELSRILRSLPDLKLRMGIHSGPVYRVADINANRNVAGGGINFAQRVMDCGDAGHILVSREVAEVIGQLSGWRPMLHDLREVEVKHGVRIHIYNLYSDKAGNSAMPKKLAASKAAAAGPELKPAQEPARFRWKAPAGAAILVIGLAVAGWLLFSRKVHALTDKDTIVIADFTNTTGDTLFDGTLRQGLSVQLEQSPFFSAIPVARIQQTLRSMGQSADAALTSQISRDLCRRVGSKVYIAGSVANLGNSYVIGLSAVDCATGHTAAQEDAKASGKENVLDALDQAAVKLRTTLGEPLTTVKKFDTPTKQSLTSSLEALHTYSLGQRTRLADDDVGAAPFFQQAVKFDANFVMAYFWLGFTYANIGEETLATQNTRKAYDLRDRVSERERFRIEGLYYNSVGNLDKARELYERWAQTYPRDWEPPDHLFVIYRRLGWNQYEKGLAAALEDVNAYPESDIVYANLIDTYLSMNRIEDAQATAQEARSKKLDSPYLRVRLYELAFLQNDVAAMAQHVSWAADKPGIEEEMLENESDTMAYFGQLRKSREYLHRAVASAQRSEDTGAAAVYESGAAIREALFGNAEEARRRAAAALAFSNDRPVQSRVALGLALAGDLAHAQELVDDLAKRFPENTTVQFTYVPMIRAQLALNRNNAGKAIELLQAAAPYELGIAGGLYPVYVRGNAYVTAHEGSEAAAEFQEILNHRGIIVNEPVGALAHLGLGRAYAVQGDTAKARAAYQNFLTLWKDADPDIPILIAAKAEYAKLK
jgi:class 3 adenylate cyclase/tetratricopeptide (TPR) repeat protein